ncbi:MAG: hypothetical protein SVZ03_04680 [Spirochaetota bacterium]|nr:hypothetical protein [Spirochaetota bacterium]
MNAKILYILFIILIVISSHSCGEEENNNQIFISGNLEIDEGIFGTAFMVISRAVDDFEVIEENPQDFIIKIVAVEPIDHSFNIDLSESSLRPGEEVLLFGFVDKDYNYGIPNPTEGDYVGFYIDRDDYSPYYVLKSGHNEDISIDINRSVYDFEAYISGTIDGDYKGEIMVVAFTGEMPSMNIDDFDIDGVIGYKKLTKAESPVSFSMKIMPYGYNVPIENVYLIAMFDENANEKPDAGDMIGFYSDEYNNLPTKLTIREGILDNKHINFDIDKVIRLAEPSGYDIPLCGSMELPDGEIYDEESNPIYIAVIEADDPMVLLDNLEDFSVAMKYLKCFEKVQQPKNGTQIIEYNIDLSETDLNAGDEILIFAMWDMNYAGGLPSPLTPGDTVGFYINLSAFSPTYRLRDDSNNNIDFKLNRSVYDFEAEISGTIIGNDTGDLTIVAYAGELTSLNFDDIEGMFDIDAIVGYQQLEKGASDLDYTMKVLPFGKNIPIENVLIIAFLDKNNNGIPDGGDRIGFHTDDPMKLPTLLTIKRGFYRNRNIEMMMDLPKQSGHDISISGSFEKPPGYDKNSNPIFLIVAQMSIEDIDLLFKEPFKYIKYFYKMPPGENEFNIDLSSTDLTPGDIDDHEDDIFVVALWDRDFNGFLAPTEGDYLGFLISKEDFAFSYNLHEGVNEITTNGYELNINRRFYQHNSYITFWLSRGWLSSSTFNQDDKIIVAAIQADGIDYYNMKVNIDYAVGIAIAKPIFGSEYTSSMSILPAIYKEIDVEDPFAIENLYIFSIHDKSPSNLRPDIGEYLGFYWLDYMDIAIPNLWDLTDEENILPKSVRFNTFIHTIITF